MTVFLYIIIGLWLAKALFQIIRALVPIAYGLGCGLISLTARILASIMDFSAWIWRLARWAEGPSQPAATHAAKKSRHPKLSFDFDRRLDTMYIKHVDFCHRRSAAGASPGVL